MSTSGELGAAGAPGTRLIITKMVLENFKSYAGAQEIGPFHKSFSSVVGPNGSGKSNVIDAMLFVFTKRAKQLRQAKVSDLIHKSEHHPNLSFCRVTVFFATILDTEDRDTYSVVPGSEFRISRVGRTDNTSDYYLNDKKVPMKDVADLLKAQGIDLDHNRFLILQGEVESIAMMKPRRAENNENSEDGLLEWLEDMIGSVRFRQPIEEKSTTLEGLNERRTGAVNRMKISEKEKSDVEASKLEAEEYLFHERQALRLRVLRSRILSKKESAKLAKLQEDSKEMMEEFRSKREFLDREDAELKKMSKTYEKERKDYEATTSILEQIQKEFAVYEKRDQELGLVISQSTTQEKKKGDAIRKEETRLGLEENKLRVAKQELGKKQAELEAMKPKLEKAEKVLQQLLDDLAGSVAPIRSKIAESKTQRVPLAEKLGKMHNQQSDRRDRLRKTRDVLAELEQQRSEVQKRLDETSRALSEVSAAASGSAKGEFGDEPSCKSKLKELELQASKLSEELKAKEAAVRQLASKLGDLRQHSAINGPKQRTGKNQKRLVDVLMEAKELKGIFGRLGDLGKIPAEFDVAVSTAGSGWFDSIVCESTEDAQRSVEYMKKHQLGRATFVMLDKVQPEYARSIQRESQQSLSGLKEQNVHKLLDLIECEDSKFKAAFYRALSDTLVAPNLDVAMKVAYGKQGGSRRRVVTLDGNLLEASGAMTGGGNRQLSGAMQLISGSSSKRQSHKSAPNAADDDNDNDNDEDIETLEHELGKRQAELADAQKRKFATDEQLNSVRSELQRMQSAAAMLSSKRASITQQTERLQATLTDVEERIAENQSIFKDLEKSIAADDKAVEKLTAQIAELDAKISDFEKELDAVGGVKLATSRYEAESLQQEVSTVESDVMRISASLASDTKAYEKDTKSLEKLRSDMRELLVKREKAVEDRKKLEEEALEFLQRFQAIQGEAQAKGAALEQLEKEYKSRKHESEKKKALLVDLEARVSEYERAISDCKSAASRLESERTSAQRKLDELIKVHTQEIGASFDREQESSAADGMPDDQLFSQVPEDVHNAIAIAESKQKALKVNVRAITEFAAKKQEWEAHCTNVERISEERRQVSSDLEELKRDRLAVFTEGFDIISRRLKEMYQMITLGGDAELEWVDQMDPFSEGIVFTVRPPRKTWKQIRNLSGGEKTLASLALVFALHHYKPTPLYVMDEIDAALDFRNVSIVANYIKQRTRDAQFVIISLRNNMFELADRLIGVYKTSNQTKTVTVNPRALAAH
eukprot:ANDGO_01241.mRNA.1 Structural maintenance of chromosomes protein 4